MERTYPDFYTQIPRWTPNCNMNHAAEPKISRRDFLIAGISLGSLLIPGLSGSDRASSILQKILESAHPHEPVIQGGLVSLPGYGKLYIASDFHSRYSDFERWLDRTRILHRINSGEEAYGLILGDAVDMKPGDPFAEDDGDTRIIERILEIQTDLAEKGHRFLFIAGNHEDRCVSIYERLRMEEGMTSSNQQQMIKDLFSSQHGDYYRQFNFVARMNDERCAYLKSLPVAVVTENGIVGIHAGPSVSLLSPKDIVTRDDTVVEEILWTRPVEVQKEGYDPRDLAVFLQRMGDSTLVVSGHTPLDYLPEEVLRDNIGDYGGHQVILATSYGCLPDGKSYLVLDMKTQYEDTSELQAGNEIRLLEEPRLISLYASGDPVSPPAQLSENPPG